VDTCDAVRCHAAPEHERAIPLLRRGADALTARRGVMDAAQSRRNLGWVLGMTGDRDGATRELRRRTTCSCGWGAEAGSRADARR